MEKENTFFYRDKDKERANIVRCQMDTILNKFLEMADADQKAEYEKVCQHFRAMIEDTNPAFFDD